jgi:hypothetical protein
MKQLILPFSLHPGQGFSGTVFSGVLVFEWSRNTGAGLITGQAVVVFSQVLT